MSESENFLKPLSSLEQKIVDFVEPILAMQHCELVSIKINNVNKRPRVVLFVERASLEELSTLSRLISDVLDVENAKSNWLSHAYYLEVSSPGIERPLTKKSHFKKALGCLIRVVTPMETRRAKLLKWDLEDGILLEEPGQNSSVENLILWEDVKEANIIYQH